LTVGVNELPSTAEQWKNSFKAATTYRWCCVAISYLRLRKCRKACTAFLAPWKPVD
jgi:hypothetical protein